MTIKRIAYIVVQNKDIGICVTMDIPLLWAAFLRGVF